MWFNTHPFFLLCWFHDSGTSRACIEALLHLSSCLYYSGESGLSPSKLMGEKLWASFLLHTSSSKHLFPACVSRMLRENTLHGGRTWWEERCPSDKIPVLKGLLAILILICLEHFINHGLQERRHGKKADNLNDCPTLGGKSQVRYFFLPCMKRNNRILWYLLSLLFYDTYSLLTSFLLHWFVYNTHNMIHTHSSHIHIFSHINTCAHTHTLIHTPHTHA